MTHDSNFPGNSGNYKLSEVAVDRGIPLLNGSAAQQNALVALEAAFRGLAEVARKSNYILRSSGEIKWTGTQIQFDANSMANNIILEILATEGSVNSAFSLNLQGSMVSNTVNTFLNISMNDGDILYFELNSSLLVDQGSSFNIENGVNGGSIQSGFRLIKQPMSTAMPKIQIGSANSGSMFYIPLALRRGSDLLWIPHGIAWQAGTQSKMGAIIVAGFDAYPERFVSNQTELLSAITSLSAVNGGVILLKNAMTIDQNINVTTGIKIIGRGVDKNAVTLLNGGSFSLQGRSTLDGVKVVTDSLFVGTAVIITSDSNRVLNSRIDVSASADSNTVIAVSISGSNNRVKDCLIDGVLSTNRIGVNYISGSNNADVDCVYT